MSCNPLERKGETQISIQNGGKSASVDFEKGGDVFQSVGGGERGE